MLTAHAIIRWNVLLGAPAQAYYSSCPQWLVRGVKSQRGWAPQRDTGQSSDLVGG